MRPLLFVFVFLVVLPQVSVAVDADVPVVKLVGTDRSSTAMDADVPEVDIVATDRSSTTLNITAGPSGAPAGFTVEWMYDASYKALDDWPEVPNPSIYVCDFTGTPTLTTTAGVSRYLLGPGEAIKVEVGDLFDETGVATTYLSELAAGTDYVFRVFANPSGTLRQSPFSQTLYLGTEELTGLDCTLTQGFWKNHPAAWPVLNLTLGTVSYDQTELLSIFKTPARGNGLIFLAHQLIATKLNLANGANPVPIAATVAAADALIGGLIIPPVGGGSLAPAVASPLTETLDLFNNGQIPGQDCGVVQIEESSWGSVKAIYR